MKLGREVNAIGGVLVLSAMGMIAVAGCDGDVKTTDDGEVSVGGAGGGTAGAGAGGDATTSAGGGGVGGGGAGGAPDDCENAPTYLDNLYRAAAACSAADPVPHCQGVVDGFCCPVVVESASSAATQAYLDFLEITKTQCPDMWDTCAVVDCGLPTGGTCVDDPSGDGICEPDF